MPAEGPSFGIAPSGTWMLMSFFSNASGSMPSSSWWAITHSWAIVADSFITAPRLPVRLTLPLPGVSTDSI